jgi:hypothetical protein
LEVLATEPKEEDFAGKAQVSVPEERDSLLEEAEDSGEWSADFEGWSSAGSRPPGSILPAQQIA